MGSILSKLFGGNHNSSNNNQQEPILALPAPPPHNSATTSASNVPTNSATLTKCKRGPDLKAASPPSNNTPIPLPAVPEPPVLAAKTNILEVQLDEEAFKDQKPKIYTTTLETRIEPSAPHPLEQALQNSNKPTEPSCGKRWIHTTCSVPPKSKWSPITSTNSSTSNLSTVPPTPVAEPPKSPVDEAKPAKGNDDITAHGEAEIEDAIIKIQAGVRGFLTRKHLKPDQKNGDEDEDEELEDKDSTLMDNTILPPPVNFESSVTSSVSATTTSSNLSFKLNPTTINNNNKRVETPVPGSPFASDMEERQPKPQPEPQSPIDLIKNTEELEIFKKISEINQLLSFDDEQDKAPKVTEPEPFENIINQIPQEFSSRVNTVLGQLDQTIQDEEDKLISHDEPIVPIVSAFERSDDFTSEFINDQCQSLLDTANDELVSAKDVIEEHRQNILSGIESFVQPLLSDVEQSKDELVEEVSQNLETQMASVPIVIEKAPSLDIEEEQEQDESELTAEKAAIRIQAAFRGFEVRKSLSREHSPVRNMEENLVDEEEEREETIVSEPVQELEPVQESKPEREFEPKSEQEEQSNLDSILNIPLKEGFEKIVAGEVDIEKSMKELETSINRDLLAEVNNKSETLAENIVDTKQMVETQLESIVDDTKNVAESEFLKDICDSIKDESTITVTELVDSLVVESSTPDVSLDKEISSSSPISSTAQPSKIPVLQRTPPDSPKSGILKESVELANKLAIPEAVTQAMAEFNNESNQSIIDDDDDPESTSVSISSPIPLRASSPNPFSKKRNRRHRKK